MYKLLIPISLSLLLGCASAEGVSTEGGASASVGSFVRVADKASPGSSRDRINVPRQRVTAHALAPFAYGDAEQLGFSNSVFARLGDQVADWVANGEIVGAEMLVVKRGEIAWHEVIGLRDLETGEPLVPAGVFRIRSMTKPILGTAALRLIDRGVLSLDDPASRYISAFKAERWKDVTVRRLLEHTAGLENSSFPRDRASYASLRESVDDLATVEPSRSLGEFYYSDAGSAILGAVLEQASGQPLRRLLEQEVLEPLGLHDTHTSYEPGVSWSERVNSTHAWNADDQSHQRYWHPSEQQEMPYFRASGGVYSTIFDYAVFLRHWLHAIRGEEAEFLSPSLAQAAVSQVTEVPYGMHWEAISADGQLPKLFGHGGSDGTLALCIPGEDLLVLYFTQSRRCDCRDQFSMLAGITGEFGALAEYASLGRWRDREPDMAPVKLSDADRARYAGWYDARGKTVEVRDENGVLRLLRGMNSPRESSLLGGLTTNSNGSIVCTPSQAVPFPSVDLIPLGNHRFALARTKDGRLIEHYWPELDLVFQEHNGEIIGYEVAYDPQAIERGLRYRWEIAGPAPKRESLPVELQANIGGIYESGSFGMVEVLAYPDRAELKFGSDMETMWYQGAGYFLSTRGDVVSFARNPATGRQRLRVLEKVGFAYEFERTKKNAPGN